MSTSSAGAPTVRSSSGLAEPSAVLSVGGRCERAKATRLPKPRAAPPERSDGNVGPPSCTSLGMALGTALGMALGTALGERPSGGGGGGIGCGVSGGGDVN